MQKSVFDPLKMHDSGFKLTPEWVSSIGDNIHNGLFMNNALPLTLYRCLSYTFRGGFHMHAMVQSKVTLARPATLNASGTADIGYRLGSHPRDIHSLIIKPPFTKRLKENVFFRIFAGKAVQFGQKLMVQVHPWNCRARKHTHGGRRLHI